LNLDDVDLLKVASGERQFQNTQPIASIYAGDQFGHFVSQLGDGRSCLIGQTQGYELSLKGTGKTPYSRGADGRAVLRSSIREYLCSIAMKGLNIATTKALTLVGSETEVYREQIEPGAIVMRTALVIFVLEILNCSLHAGKRSKLSNWQILLLIIITHIAKVVINI
jgi:uncharacterized protein YdiU (UPF0061 family)